MHGLGQAHKAIKSARRIAIAGHVNPDGDSIGSLLALGLALERLGKEVVMLSADGVPRRYLALPGASRIVKAVTTPVDLAIAVDCSNREILGRSFEAFQRAGTILEIDHHEFRRPFGQARYIDTKAAAVGEMIHDLIIYLGIRITGAIAQNLLASIVVETNSFRLPNVRERTFEICTDLLKKGVDFYALTDAIFWSRSRQSVFLSGICFSRCRFTDRGRLAWSVVRRDDFRKTGGRDEDVDTVADEMRSIQGVDIAVLFREKDRQTLRVSLRSKDRINVGGVAEAYNGGGHFDVAGCSIPNTPLAMRGLLRRARGLL